MQPMTHRHTRSLDIFYKKHRNKCTICGKVFIEGSTVHVGYLHNGEHAVLCDNCRHMLRETVVRYYHMADLFEIPCPNDKLWRYMDLAKFISIISSKKLYFSSLQSFDDSFEGAKGTISRKKGWDDFYLESFRNAAKTIPGKDYSNVTDSEIEADAQRLLRQMEEIGQLEKQSVYVNCWHDNEYESEAMWKLYSMNVTNAVAIQTTVEKLYLSLNRSPSIDIGKVNYIDFDQRYAPVNGAYWFKRKAFEHEREVRAVLHSHNFHQNEIYQHGILIPIDIDMLIDKIYISPYAQSWFTDVVRSVMEKYDVDKPVCYSKLIDNSNFAPLTSQLFSRN